MNVEEGTQSSEQQTEGQTSETQTTEQTKTPELDENGQPKPLIAGEPKPAVAEPEPFVPLTATDITFPEGLEVTDESRDAALAIINNRDLSPKEQLQGLVDLQGKLAKEASDTISETWANTQKEWQDAVKADPTIGGDKLPATLSAVNKLVGEYGSPELLEAFALTGAGNNVHVIKFLHTVAGKLLEGGPVQATGPTNQETDRAQRMFPSMKQ